MIGLDTNVLVRIAVHDDPQQVRHAQKLMRSLSAEDPGWISTPCLLEFVWVLTRRYRVAREDVARFVEDLLSTDSIVIEHWENVANALALFRRGKADFGDCLIVTSARAAGCRKTVTFDEIAARDTGMELIS